MTRVFSDSAGLFRLAWPLKTPQISARPQHSHHLPSHRLPREQGWGGAKVLVDPKEPHPLAQLSSSPFKSQLVSQDGSQGKVLRVWMGGPQVWARTPWLEAVTALTQLDQVSCFLSREAATFLSLETPSD